MLEAIQHNYEAWQSHVSQADFWWQLIILTAAVAAASTVRTFIRMKLRVQDNPVPLTRLMEFGDNGIVLELRIWILDPENGLGGVRSEVNLAIWRAFKKAGITIPYPQRDIHFKDSAVVRTAVESDHG